MKSCIKLLIYETSFYNFFSKKFEPRRAIKTLRRK